MAKTAIGLHLAPYRATMVRIRWGLKGSHIDLVRQETATSDEGRKPLAALAIPQGSVLNVSMGADTVFQRIVSLPFTDRARVRQLAPLEAEESLPLPLEKLLTHSHPLGKTDTGAQALVVATPLEKVQATLAELHELGLDAKTIDSDQAALAAVAAMALSGRKSVLVVDLDGYHSQGVYVGNAGGERYLGVAGNASAPELHAEIARLIASLSDEGRPVNAVYLTGPDALAADLALWREATGLPVELMPFPKRLGAPPAKADAPWPSWAIPLGLALDEAFPASAQRVNLLTGPYSRETESASLKSTARTFGVYGLILLAIWGASIAFEWAYKKKQLDAMNLAVRKLFVTALPDVKNVVDEVAQLKQRLTDQEERARQLGSLMNREVSPLRILKEFSDRIPPDIKVEFRDFVAEPERIKVEGETTSFDAIDKIQAKLAEYPWFTSVAVSDAKASVDQKKVIFKLTIQLGQKAAQ